MNPYDLHSSSAPAGVLRDFLNGVVALAASGMKPSLVNVPGMPDDIRVYHAPGKSELTLLTLPQPPKRHSVDNLASLIELARDNPGVVWYDFEQIQLVKSAEPNTPDRREGATLTFTPGRAFGVLEEMAERGGTTFTQKDLIHFLRVQMGPYCDGEALKLLAAAKNVKFRKQEDSEAIIEHGKASVGKSLQASLHNATNIPESITFLCDVYENPGCGYTALVRVAVDVDAEKGTFKLCPFGGEISNAYLRAQDDMLKDLREALGPDYPILNGRYA